MTGSVKIAVMTDLHAYDPDKVKPGDEPSWLRTDGNRSGGPLADPFQALQHLITTEGISSDYLFCCGDLTDKAYPSALSYVWSNVHDLGTAMGAQVIATAGNHDIDSRNAYNNIMPMALLKKLKPRFPLNEENIFNKYWAQDFVLLDLSKIRIVNLNSSAAHGYGGEQAKTHYERGFVSEATIESILSELKSEGHRPCNVLLCHHHPIRNNLIYADDYSEMLNGDKLLAGLERAGVGDWMVIHGHKHTSRLAYASGGASSAVILSAGSFSARIPAIMSGARNEFYLVELQNSSAFAPLRGTVRTWAYDLGSGWRAAQTAGGGLPDRCGFGTRTHPRVLANMLRSSLTDPLAPVEWSLLETQMPELEFILPTDLEEVLRILEAEHVGIQRSATGFPSQLQFRP